MLAVGRLHLVLICYKLCSQEVLINLCIQIIPVGHYKKSKITGTFVLDFAGEHYHRVALSAALRMPKHAQLALKLFAIKKSIIGVVDAKELVVFCDNLCTAAVVKDKVFNVVKQNVLFA